jgi:hypothetical protein
MLDHRLDRLRRYACATYARRGGQRDRRPAHNTDTNTGFGRLVTRTLPARMRSTRMTRSMAVEMLPGEAGGRVWLEGLVWLDTHP